ncbi:MAG TPA: O-sialoglycoprotein endopeptidase [Bacillota bacterium]|nr:O-sialoglycoprotein endopeptidase [Bacillota bacterium]
MKYILGLDTSYYTSSLACVSLDGEILLNKQVILEVARGDRGLQQSKAIFTHLQNLPSITSAVHSTIKEAELVAVCASVRPRPYKDSYMPVFVLSKSLGQSIANTANVPFYETSHQENHIMAGLHRLEAFSNNRLLVVHLSGGTSELLDVRVKPTGFDIQLIGSTLDLHAGQFVDRVGVAIGLTFPSGPQLEKLAMEEVSSFDLEYHVKDLNISFSGPESYAQRQILQGVNNTRIARGVYNTLLKTLSKWLTNAVKKGYPRDVLLVGGVSSSMILRNGLLSDPKLKENDISLYFADPKLSKDNAVGSALLGLNMFKKNKIDLSCKGGI